MTQQSIYVSEFSGFAHLRSAGERLRWLAHPFACFYVKYDRRTGQCTLFSLNFRRKSRVFHTFPTASDHLAEYGRGLVFKG